MDELFNFIEENNIPVIKIIIKRIYILYRDDLEFNFIPQIFTEFINNKLSENLEVTEINRFISNIT